MKGGENHNPNGLISPTKMKIIVFSGDNESCNFYVSNCAAFIVHLFNSRRFSSKVFIALNTLGVAALFPKSK